ncbi:MAG: signal recognition particle protein [Myxococcota bacterium]
MFDVLTKGFKNAQLALQGKTELTEDNLGPALREVRTSLLQADVDLGVTKDFLARVRDKALGDIVPVRVSGRKVRLSPQDWFVKACHDELVDLMGPVDTSLDMTASPSVLMMIGLQGSGKTTTTGKIARKLLAEGKKPLLVAADVYRPAAVDQLRVIGRKLGVPVFHEPDTHPVELAKKGVTQARNTDRDFVIIDTAGRLAIDETLMQEVVDIKEAVRPRNVFFVVDAMIGQDAVRTAKAFDERLDFTGFVLTKLDGDARGGAALSIKAITGKPIKFLGQGEGLDRLEEFRPDGLAQRILGMGDVVGLVQDFEKHVDKVEAEKDAKKMLRGDFGYDDFVKQIKTIRRMGPIRDLLSKIPGLGGMLDQIPEEALDERELDRTLAIIGSMTLEERKIPDVMNDSRMRRIARGCGRDMGDVKELHDRFLQARQMMKGLGGMMGNPAQMAQMQQMMSGGGMPGMPGMGMPGLGAAPEPRKTLSAEEKMARRKKQKAAKKARKRNRR